jgi:hypothetical protein
MYRALYENGSANPRLIEIKAGPDGVLLFGTTSGESQLIGPVIGRLVD